MQVSKNRFVFFVAVGTSCNCHQTLGVHLTIKQLNKIKDNRPVTLIEQSL